MSKTDRARKRARAALPGLAPVKPANARTGKPRKKRGADRMAEIAEDPMRPVLEARARQMGADATSREVRAAMRSQSHGEAQQRAILLSKGVRDPEALTSAYRAISGAYERYTRIVMAGWCYPKSITMPMMPERMSDAMDHTPDLRTENERYLDAASKWQRYLDILERLGEPIASNFWAGFYGFAPLHDGGTVTPAGRRFVAAMVAITEALDRPG